jgi:Xaa-Pro dipeptidase
VGRNLRYFTGFYTQGWINPSRPRYFLLPLEGEPVAVVPSGQAIGFRRMSWVTDVRAWPAPRPHDDGFSLIVDALRSRVTRKGRVAVETGLEMRMGTPVGEYLRIRDALGDVDFVDATPIIRPLRNVKSAAELACMRQMSQIASNAFDDFARTFTAGQTERSVYRTFHKLLLEHGADEVPYVIPVGGPHGYDQINTAPSDRVLGTGDLLLVDVCASLRGYFADVDRNFALERTADEFIEAYALAFEATQAGIDAVRPGRTAEDVFRAMAKVLDPAGRPQLPSGRMGHGVGMDSAEPPSLMPGDHTVLEEGMVLAIEPFVTLPGVETMPWRLMVHEENVAVTQTRCELLSRRVAPNLPII